MKFFSPASADPSIFRRDAGHGFEHPNNQDGCRAADTADAWRRTTDFVAATLKK